MAIVIDDVEIERLAQSIATAEGVPVTEVVREPAVSLASAACRPEGGPTRAPRGSGTRGGCSARADAARHAQ